MDPLSFKVETVLVIKHLQNDVILVAKGDGVVRKNHFDFRAGNWQLGLDHSVCKLSTVQLINVCATQACVEVLLTIQVFYKYGDHLVTQLVGLLV